MRLCVLISHLYNRTTNSLPTVGVVKIIIFTNPPVHCWKVQKKEICVDTCTIQAAPSAAHGSVGTIAFKSGHAGKGTRKHSEHSY